MNRSYARFIKLALPLIILGLVIIFSSSAPVKKIENTVIWALGPVMRAVASLTEKDNLNFAGEDHRLRAAFLEIEELRDRLSSLEKALQFKEESKAIFLGARALLYNKEFGKEFLLLDRGEEDRVRVGDFVVGLDRVFIGVVREVNKNFSKVSLASNEGETFEIKIMPLGVSALAKGIGSRTFSVELIPADSPLKPGDLAVLSPTAGFIGSGRQAFLLGEIRREIRQASESFKEARAVILFDPAILREVFILRRGS